MLRWWGWVVLVRGWVGLGWVGEAGVHTLLKRQGAQKRCYSTCSDPPELFPKGRALFALPIKGNPHSGPA